MTFNYEYKTTPRNHQREALERTSELPAHAFFWEMRIGKSKLMIDNIAYLYEQGKITGALIVAPNGVDLNWILDEIPLHLPDRIKKQSRILRFNTSKSGTKWHKEEVKWVREHAGLAIMTMSYDAFMTHEGKQAALKFMEQRPIFYVLDESVSIKTPGAKRTMRITRTAHRAKYRRILDGYPAPKGAFDLYSQIKFLDEEFWLRHGWESATAFRSYFGVFEQKTNHNTNTDYQILLGYQHLEELNALIVPISSRLLQKDVLDIQPKNYEFRYFELTPKQREMYEQLETDYRLWINNESNLVTANLAMVRELRLQQISCGYLPVGDDEPIHMIEGKNPRLGLLDDLLDIQAEKSIIWARYKLDVQLISELLTKRKYSFVTYTGDTSDEDRIKAKHDFQKGEAQYFLGTPSAAGIGLTLHAAKNEYYYSNSYNLRHRKQSEDRAITDGQKHSINIYDLVGLNTRDKKIIQNMCKKMDTSDAILGDAPGIDIRTQLKEWINEE